MEPCPSNDHTITITSPHHTTSVRSPVEDSTDVVMVSNLPSFDKFHELLQVQPAGANFHVQFLESIVQDSMEELK